MPAWLRLPRRLIVGLTVLGLLAILSAAWILGHWELTPALGSDAMSVFTGLVAATCCAAAAVANVGSMRLAWIFFSLLMAMYGLGDVLWLVFGGMDGEPPILSMADALYTGGFIPAALGLLIYPVLSSARGMWGPLLLDAMVMAAAALFITQLLVLHEVTAATGGALEAFMLTVYPVTDILFAILGFLLLLRSIGQPRIDVALVVATFAIYAVSDSGYALMSVNGRDTTGTVIDLGYAVAPLVLAAAALIAATTPTPRRTFRRHLSGVVSPLVPDLTAIIALAIALAIGPRDNVSIVLGIITLTAVGLRQMGQTSSGQHLRSELQRRVADRTSELAEVTEDYHRLDAMKYEFVTAVSHELRTPLSAIRGSLEMLQDGDAGALSDEASRMVAVASRGGERLSRLVNEIIDLERLESGGFGFAPALHEVSTLIAEATQALLPLADKQEIEIRVDAAAGRAWCDSDRVEQVLVNLLGNALKFSPPRTTVTVTARRRGDEFVVSVHDEGRGIPAAELEAVFDRFHQVEAGDSCNEAGAGLGLTICQRIIGSHGGSIWVESPNEDGATFCFTLPAESFLPDDHEPGPPTGPTSMAATSASARSLG